MLLADGWGQQKASRSDFFEDGLNLSKAVRICERFQSVEDDYPEEDYREEADENTAITI